MVLRYRSWPNHYPCKVARWFSQVFQPLDLQLKTNVIRITATCLKTCYNTNNPQPQWIHPPLHPRFQMLTDALTNSFGRAALGSAAPASGAPDLTPLAVRRKPFLRCHSCMVIWAFIRSKTICPAVTPLPESYYGSGWRSASGLRRDDSGILIGRITFGIKSGHVKTKINITADLQVSVPQIMTSFGAVRLAIPCPFCILLLSKSCHYIGFPTTGSAMTIGDNWSNGHHRH